MLVKNIHLSPPPPFIPCRVIIGAPRGTFPGGLTTVQDFGMPGVSKTGLVYDCGLVGDPRCRGVTGDTALYSPPNATTDTIDSRIEESQSSRDSFPDALSEGRLFDQQRMYL